MWIQQLQSAHWNEAAAICLCAYALGCFTAGYYLVHFLANKDLREIGSGSVGARNVGRVLGKPAFFLTVLFDFSKGAFAVVAARHFTADDWLVALAMIAVVLGHIWPVQLRFRGGKGMATSLGALLAYDPHLALTFAVLFLCLLATVRKTVLPALFAIGIVPVAGTLLGHTHIEVFLLSVLSGLVLIAHRKNLIEQFTAIAARRHLNPKPDHTQS